MRDGVFVSYSHKDVKVVEQIVSIIREKSGKEVWFDHKLRGGENYFSAIANQIIENKYFVFVVSENSVMSDWCLRELEFAASEKRHVIAIWLDNINISPRIKLVIQNTHYINWFSTPNQLFTESIEQAFSGEFINFHASATDSDHDDVIPKNKRYFLDSESIKRLQELLRAEEKEQHSICFEGENANLLGIAYELGILVDADPKKASLYYKASKYAGNLDGLYLYSALKRQEEPNNADYLADMLEAAEKGSVLALTHVGDSYYYGENGLPVNQSKAYEYFEKAARKSGIAAMYYTAYGYRKGEFLPKDFELAYMYALKAKEHGFPRAYRLLAFMYEAGQYVDKDLQKAVDMYEEAIKRGDYLSLCYQGYVYGELGQIDKKVELYRKAHEYAENGEIKSGVPYYRMAILYDDGIGVEHHPETAVAFYFKAAERSHKNARKWAVPCIKKIEGDKTELLQRAFELECEGAAYELGIIERDKRTDKKERLSEAAVKYFEAGAELGDMYCVQELLSDFAVVVGKGKTKEDRTAAIRWFRFLFANADVEFIEACRKYDILSTYYYAYAIELDYDNDVNVKDREFVLFNFKKSVEESPRFLRNIIHFAVNGYLFPSESGSGLAIDVPHAEEVLAFASEHLQEYYEYIKEKEPDTYKDEYEEAKELLKKGYRFISDCYTSGKNVSAKDKEKAKKYSEMYLKIK